MKSNKTELLVFLLAGAVLLPVIVLAGAAALFAFSQATPVITQILAWVIENAEPILSLFQCVAILVAGIWIYYHFVKGRTFSNRLNLSLVAEGISDGEKHYLKIIVAAQNVGSSRVSFNRDDSVMYVFIGRIARGALKEIVWDQERRLALDLFTDHCWVEPGESITEERLVSVLPTAKSYRVLARFRSGKEKRSISAVVRFSSHEQKQ